ncbi:hypothetical protein CRE_23413 [Caenorhabditis remanei]|uniref:F-box domain-containing protein n=1 Tax=Caenorhabditis remanei TaxID=31234 RepID=E3MGN5_CAERE|nr:hypothetical protein CRE_23413 [Caenorhabditis remanei]
MAPSFLEIPELPMEKIMNNLDFFAIQSVRKTCRDLRNFIDDKKPGIGMNYIEIDETSDDREVTLAIFPPFSMHSEDINIHLFYQNHENGCRILRAISDDGYEHKTVENLNFLDAVLHDFKIVLNSQKSVFEKVTVTSKTFFEKFEETMKSQKPYQSCAVLHSISKHLIF